MALIRSATIHIPSLSVEDIARHRDVLEKFVERISSNGYNVWTKRISLPPLSRSILSLCDEISRDLSLLSGLYIAAFNIDFELYRDISSKDLVSCMTLNPSVFSSILIREERDLEIEFLEEFYRYGTPDIFTRFAGVIGRWVLTPYFPGSASIVEEPTITISLRYVDLFDRAFTSREEYKSLVRWLRKLYRVSLEVSEELGVYFGGFDLSLSPWMSESVAELIERYSGSMISEPGVAKTILEMNRFIEKIASDAGVKTTGFNEVMLPLEEDNQLKKRALEKRLTLTSLLRLTPYCIAGVDMVVVSRERLKLRSLVRDLIASYEIKRKVHGFRIIPVNKSPGERISLGRFGEAVVIDYSLA
ncbi:MAG: DUF711 family protein [Sulfolobales archaeon]